MSESALFSPLSIRGVQFKNRVWVSPMCQYSAQDGIVSAWHHMHLGALASGGAGLVMTEATAVVPEGRISYGCPGIWSDEQAEAWRPIVEFAHSMDTKIGIQLAHAGRKGSTMLPWDDHVTIDLDEGGWTTVGPSPIAYGRFPIPSALTIDQIEALVTDFAMAAARSISIGFDLIEIHAAHGYLFHQFLSPLSNQRDDAYGRNFAGRAKFLLQASLAVRQVIPTNVPLFVRISATDWMPDGWSVDDSVHLSQLLKEVGVDLIDVSSGGLVHDAKIVSGPGYQVPFAARIRSEVDMPTSAVGLITETRQAESIVANGDADAVMLARAMLRNPRWALNAAEELGVVIPWPKQLERARTISPRPSPQ
jgi:2,4-dienoyl-CoA reductase-like NADH-dependent reductase (Old Yellow Enzyme family)